MAKIISVINQKGGCGKTTSCYNLAAAFVEKGYRVLMIDNDQQGSLTLYCGFEPRDFENTMDMIYLGQIEAAKAIYDTKIPNLSLIPANIKLAKVDVVMTGWGTVSRDILLHALEPVRDLFDFILIDNPPALGMLTINSLTCSDYILIPCQTSPLCTMALDDLFETIDNAQRMKPTIKVLGILATIHRKSVKIFREELENLEKNHHVIGVIKESADIANSIVQGIPVIKYNRRAEVSQQYLQAADEMLKEMEVN